MKKVAFLTGPGTRYGFGLTGVRHFIAVPKDLEATIDRIVAMGDVGLLVIDEHLARELTDERMRDIERMLHGIVLVLPAPVKAPPEVEDYAARLIRKAIGYHVRIRT